jgi:predicted DsbA family dithiol-disulfide isomerase
VSGIHASYYTDPASPESWGLEPALRRLAVELGDQLSIEPVMSGLAREFGPPVEQVSAWLDVADATGMPVDPRLWLSSPPTSSYPASLAVKAAAEQGPEIEAAYLRRLREGFACARRKLDTRDALVAEGRAVPGCDVERFAVDLGSHAVVEAFGADLERAEAVAGAAHDPATDRARIPSLEFRGEDGRAHAVHGRTSYDELRAAAQAAGAELDGSGGHPGVEDALARFGTLATAEVAAVCDLPGPRAAAELWRLAGEWRVRADRCLTGELWSAA